MFKTLLAKIVLVYELDLPLDNSYVKIKILLVYFLLTYSITLSLFNFPGKHNLASFFFFFWKCRTKFHPQSGIHL